MNNPTLAYQIVEKLWRKSRLFCSSEYDESLEYLKTILPFKIYEYRETGPYKGWEIPPKWDPQHGIIRYQGKVIFKANHPLHLIGLSTSFQGKVSVDELKKHLHYDQRDPSSIPYHFRQSYRPWERTWGFCVPKNFYDSLQEGEYEVDIAIQEAPGYLQVAEFVKPGKQPVSFAFVAHLDHPGMANDDLSGVAVGVELFQKLSKLPTKFTYRLVLVPEIIGSVFYLDKTVTNGHRVLESCFLEMLGSNTRLSLQSSHEELSELETLLEENLEKRGLDFHRGPFRSIVCNDELVWESHKIPMCSLSRYPYPEYHSDKDNLSIISEQALSESVQILLDTILELDKSIFMEKHFEGVYSLANPQYNLYIDPGQPAFGASKPAVGRLRHLMDEMSLLPKICSLNFIADQMQLPLDTVYNYLKLWEEKGLITLI